MFSPHCPGLGGSPPRSESPHRSSAVHWAECCPQRLQIHTGGGRRRPWCGHNVSGEGEESPEVGVQLGCVSTCEDKVMVGLCIADKCSSSAQLNYSHVAFKLKLEEIVGDFGSALTRKHKHLVPAYSHWEVATRWRNLTTLGNLMDAGGETINVNTLMQCWSGFYFQ